MRYLWLAHAIPYPPKAGFLLRSYNLLRELTRYHTVDLAAFVQEGWVRALFPTLEEGLQESRRELETFCGTVTFLPIESQRYRWGRPATALRSLVNGSSYAANWLAGSAARSAIARQIATAHYDLVHFDAVALLPYRSLAVDVRKSLMHHNVESHMLLRRAENSTNLIGRQYFRHEGRKLQEMERRTAPEFDVHITCSELDSERLRRIVPAANIAAIPNGVDCDYFVSSRPVPRAGSLIFVGSMNWYPNVDAMRFFLQEVWPQLKQRVPAVTLDIVGSQPPESLVRLAQSHPGVTVHGYVPDVRPLLDSAALVICPIRDGGGTKLKLLDAFAMMKCVVAHPIACEGIDALPGRDVIHASTPEDFVAAILALLADEERRLQVGRAARDLVEKHYSFRSIGAQFTALLERTVRDAALPK
jgi:polysaccharide biosynthesis protein PslH